MCNIYEIKWYNIYITLKFSFYATVCLSATADDDELLYTWPAQPLYSKGVRRLSYSNQSNSANKASCSKDFLP